MAERSGALPAADRSVLKYSERRDDMEEERGVQDGTYEKKQVFILVIDFHDVNGITCSVHRHLGLGDRRER